MAFLHKTKAAAISTGAPSATHGRFAERRIDAPLWRAGFGRE
jgi:hypothetical protein